MKIQDYKQSKKELKRLNKIENKNAEAYNKKDSEIKNKFWDLKKELEAEEREEREIIDKALEKQKADTEKQEQPHKEKTKQFNRIIEFIRISKKEHNLNFEVYKMDYPKDRKGEVIRTKSGDYPEEIQIDYKPLDTIRNDGFIKLKIFITENRKPKNKFSLIAVGNTIFNKDILNIPYSYYNFGCHINSANIETGIKDFPTKEEVKEYYKRNFGKILKDFREKHKKAEEEYKRVISETDTKEWEIAYLESQKYYYKNLYSHGEETKKYKQIIKKLKALK